MTKVKILALTLVFTLFLGTASLLSVSAKDVWAEGINVPFQCEYKEAVVKKLGMPAEGDDGIYNYGEVYEYRASPDESSVEEATPDYVLLVASTNQLTPYIDGEVFGEYYVRQIGHWNPYGLALYVYAPKTDEIYTLREAYDMELDGIEAVFTDFQLGALAGDVTGDRVLNVKDATEIQKRIAGISSFPNPYDPIGELYGEYSADDGGPLVLSDFNRDGKTNIRDATAIQKRVAGIE